MPVGSRHTQQNGLSTRPDASAVPMHALCLRRVEELHLDSPRLRPNRAELDARLWVEEKP